MLRPGGHGLIIDLRGDASPEAISGEVDGMGLTVMNKLLTKLAFKVMLLKRAYTKEQFEQMLRETAFSRTQVTVSGMGLEIAMTK